MKFWKAALIVGLVVFMIPLFMITTLVGQKNTFFDVAKEKGIEIADAADVSSKDAEKIISALDDNDALAFDGAPIEIKKIKEALAFEQMTYSRAVDTFATREVTIEEYYDYDRHGEYLYLDDRDIGRRNQTGIETLQYETEEYPYRVPWQVMVAADFLTNNERIGFTTDALQSIYKYAYAGSKPYFKKNIGTTDYEYLEVDNHVVAQEPSLYIAYDSDYNLNEGGGNYTTYYKENKEVTTVKYYDYDEDDGYELVDKNQTIVRTVTTKDPRPLLKQIITPYKQVTYSYSKKEVRDELVNERSSVKVHRNDDGEKTGKTVTTVKRFFTIAEVDDGNISEYVDDEVFEAYLKDIGLTEDREDLLQFASLNIGGVEAVSEMLSVSDSSLMFVSDIYYNGLQYMDIEMTPEELAATIPRFFQNDTRWSKMPYGNSTIGRGGCGPTSMAMVVTGLTRSIVSPVEMAYLSAGNGYKVSEGTRWDFFAFAASRYGLKVKQATPSNYGEMLEALKNGNPVIASVGPGHFTSNGHFIVLVAIDQDGIVVNDPYDPYDKKNKSWDPRIIISEASQYFIVEKGGLS